MTTVHKLHEWNLSPAEARQLQEKLSGQVTLHPMRKKPRFIAGLDCSLDKRKGKIFAAALGRADPLLPLEDDGRLDDPGLRESFVTRAYAYHDWKQLCARGLSAHRLIGFYSRYKYLVMAHHVPAYQKLGKMLANAGKATTTAAVSAGKLAATASARSSVT